MSISDPKVRLEAGPASPAFVRFARETLGCNCPPEVFSLVEDDRAPVPALPGIGRRFAVGGRLLIYVSETTDPGLAAMRLGAWVSAGVAERERRGMNRLRLVVTLRDLTPEAVSTLESAFSQLPELALSRGAPEGARVHLHCLPQGALAFA